MHQQLTSFAIASGKIDSKRGVITDCSVITIGPALGHNMRIDATTLEQVVECGNAFVGGVRVRFAEEDHEGGAATIAGTLRKFRIDGDQVRADLHLLKKSPAYDRILEMAEEIPDQFGLSIVFSGVHEMDDDDNRIARCDELYGVDIVARPAANPAGLFTVPVDTGKDSDMATTKKPDDQAKELEVQFAQTSQALKDAETALKAKDESITALTGEKTSLTTKVAELEAALKAKTDEAAKSVESLQSCAVEIEQLKKDVDAAKQSAGAKAQEQLAAIGVPAVVAEAKPEQPKQFTSKADAVKELERLSKEDPAQAREFYLKHKTILN